MRFRQPADQLRRVFAHREQLDIVILVEGDCIVRALARMRAARRAIPGYGHPLHKSLDPRADRLLAIARQSKLAGEHIEIALSVERCIPELIGKPLAMNVSAAIGAVLLDAGYPLLAVKGIPLLARTASLVAHLLEEQERPIGFALADSGSSSVQYDGVLPAGDREVAHHVQAVSTPGRPARDHGDDDLGHRPDQSLHLEDVQPSEPGRIYGG